MSFWQRVRDFFVSPSRVRHDEQDAWYAPEAEWPSFAANAEVEDAEPPADPVEIGEAVVDKNGEPVIVLGLFSGAVRRGPLFVRRVGKGGREQQFLIYDEESGIHFPASLAELDHETTTRVEGE